MTTDLVDSEAGKARERRVQVHVREDQQPHRTVLELVPGADRRVQSERCQTPLTKSRGFSPARLHSQRMSDTHASTLTVLSG